MPISKIKTNYGKIKIFSGQPPAESKGLGPEQDSIEPVVLIPGFSESITHVRELAKELGELGLVTTTFNLPRWRGRQTRQTGKKPDALTLQTDSILEVIQQQSKGERVHAVAHSLGAVGTLRAALRSPDLFASIILMQPAGLTGKTTLTNLAKRASKKTVHNQVNAAKGQKPHITDQDSHYTAAIDEESALRMSTRTTKAHLAAGAVLTKNVRLATEEALVVRDVTITDLIKQVTELGIPVNIVTSYGDELFDDSKIFDETNINTLLETGASISTIADPEAGHDTIWAQPKRTAQIIGSLVLGSLTTQRQR